MSMTMGMGMREGLERGPSDTLPPTASIPGRPGVPDYTLHTRHQHHHRGQRKPYLIFVIFFTRAKFLENKIYTGKRQFFALNR